MGGLEENRTLKVVSTIYFEAMIILDSLNNQMTIYVKISFGGKPINMGNIYRISFNV